MITITEAAAEKIKELTPDPQYALRMRVVGGGCSGLQYQMGLEDEQNPNDKVLTSNGIKVLVDMKSALYLAGAEVDYINGLMESGFKISNPNAKTTWRLRTVVPLTPALDFSPHERPGALGAASVLAHSSDIAPPRIRHPNGVHRLCLTVFTTPSGSWSSAAFSLS